MTIATSYSKDFLLADIRQHPERVMDFLLESDPVSLLVSRQGDHIRLQRLKTYAESTVRLLQESKREYQRKKAAGYNREQAIQDFLTAQDAIQQTGAGHAKDDVQNRAGHQRGRGRGKKSASKKPE